MSEPLADPLDIEPPTTIWWRASVVFHRLIHGDYWYWWKRGTRNAFRYIRVVWRDEDWDWSGLVTILAFKFEKMADAHKNGHLMKHDRSERQLRIAAHCCRRLLADEYFEKAGYDRNTWRVNGGPVDARCIAQRAAWAEDSDQRILGTLIRKHLRSWWD